LRSQWMMRQLLLLLELLRSGATRRRPWQVVRSISVCTVSDDQGGRADKNGRRGEGNDRRQRQKVAAGTSEEDAITVLLVEDDAATRMMIARALKRLGASVLLAVDGADGLAVLRRHVEKHLGHAPPQCPSGVGLVLLDKDMPVSGFTFLEALQGYRESTDPVERAMSTAYVVGCTAHGVSSTVHGFKERGAADVLLKPATGKDFERVLNQAKRLHNRKQRSL
jgi:CheY-like chemotaxis protein